MLYAVLSDIHGNFPALQAVFNDIKQQSPDKIICLGDIIGYGPSPNECIDLIKECDVILMGNHDYALLNKEITERFNFHAKMAIEWSKNQITTVNKQFISRLQYQHIENNLNFVHSTPRDPEGWGYITNIEDAMDSFDYFDAHHCFIGHTHFPVIVSNIGEVITEKKYSFKKRSRYVINVGSVGQPRDGNWRSCYTLYDSDKDTIEYKRIEYDVEKTQKKMRKVGLPEFLINRIKEGR